MANTLEPSWNGNDFQARFFWYHAAALRDDQQQHVLEVTFEADGPKGFDDVVVRYRSPGRPSSSPPGRIAVDFHQVKFHAVQSGRFGYADLISPEFINATANSLLQGLRNAKKTAVSLDGAFHLVTTDRIADGDPLGEIISGKDHSIRLDKLFVKGGDRSRFGKVRKLWRDHLELATDDELKQVLQGLHINQVARSLEDMRDEVNNRFRVVGLVTCRETADFRYDQVARELKKQQRNCLTRESFDMLCQQEGWIQTVASDLGFLNVSVRSFADVLPAHLDAAHENALSLLEKFDGRHLCQGLSWTTDVQPQIVGFLQEVRQRRNRLRLHLDAHLSIAFLAGSVLGFKSGVHVELVQKGRAGLSIWRPDDECSGPSIPVSVQSLGAGHECAVVVSLSRDGLRNVLDYVARELPNVGTVLHAKLEKGAGQAAVAGGSHAAQLADEVSEAVRTLDRPRGHATHIFIIGPNSFAFYLGQHADAIGPCIVYEFDFNNSSTGSYQPTFKIR